MYRSYSVPQRSYPVIEACEENQLFVDVFFDCASLTLCCTLQSQKGFIARLSIFSLASDTSVLRFQSCIASSEGGNQDTHCC